MNILNALKQLRDDIKTWVTNNLNALNAKIDEKTIPIDSELDSTSTNPVQNQVIAKEIDSINDRVGDTPVATQISNAIDKVPTFSGDYNDLTNAPNISEDGSDNMIIADESGNIIFKADADGIHTTAVSLNGEAAATEKYVDDAITKIPTPDVSGQINAHNTNGESHTDIRQAIEDTKEELSESIVAESNEWKVVDEAGNIIFSVDATGAHTTELTLNGESATTESYVDNAIANIEFPTIDLTDYATKKYVDDAVDGVDFTGYATETYVDNKVADLVNSAPEALNTLGELATALETHEDAYGALLETVGSKATYTDLENLKEELSESIVSESNEWKVVDNDGNIIFSVDANGVHTTELALNGEAVATEAYVDSAVASIEIPEVDFTGYATETYVTDAIANIEFPETDLTNYYTKSETDVAINAAKEEISEAIVAESTEWKVVDEAGNIIFSVDADGAHTTSLTLNGETVTNIIDTRVASLVDSAPDTLNTLNELAAALGDDPNFATTIAAEIGKKVDKVSGKGLSTNDFTNDYKSILDNLGSMAFEESDPTVPDWAKSAEKPTYTKSEVGLGNVDNTSDINKPVSTATQAALNDLKEELSESIVSESESWTLVDNSGNIVAKIDQNGLDVTSINTNAITINGLSLEDVIAAKVQEYIDTAILGGKW